MRFALAGIIVLALAPAGAAQNVQPISVSMIECGAVYDEVAEAGARRGRSEDQIETVSRTASVFREAAIAQAGAEGVADPQAHLLAHAERLRKKWQGRSSRITLVRENRDWIDYCRALGKDRGLLPLKD